MRDYNARIGNETDIIEDIDDNISERKSIDIIINDHGKSLLQFLTDNAMCILNGRFESDSNKYTSVSTRSCAVVDYIFVRQNDLQIIRNFNNYLQ